MSDSLVTVETFGSAAEAEMAKNLLQEEGIPAYVMDGDLVDTLWHLGQALGGVKLQVPESQLARARQILADTSSETDGTDIDDYGLDEGTTARSRIRSTEPADDEGYIVEAEKDALARRAWMAAVFGIILCPPLLNLLSLWLLFRLSSAGGTLSASGRTKVIGALVVDAVVLLFVLAFGLTSGTLGMLRL